MSEPTSADVDPDDMFDEAPDDTDYGAEGAVSTGEPAVDATLASLAGLDARPTGEHAEVYEEVHRRLDGLLRGAAAEPGPPQG